MRLLQTSLMMCFGFLAACGQPTSLMIKSSLDQSGSDTPPIENNNGEGPVTPSPEPELPQSKIGICSRLNLDGVDWPSDMDDFTVNAFALAMNISGSFEGPNGWFNISNNFDGQGVSLGLFNQNLGQGSLQPLMIELRNTRNSVFRSFFTTTQYNSVNSMLTTWGGPVPTGTQKATSQEPTWPTSSPLDDPYLVEEEDDGLWFDKASNAKNQASVNWSVANIYNGSSFKSEWRTALQNMARSPNYVTLQVKAATAIHKRAYGYMSTYSMKSLRAYLFFFDIVVQNGSISNAIRDQYLAWARNNPNASENTRLKRLLEYRLTVVRKEYVNDVRARKTAVIDGTGTVHGSRRNFANEFCVDRWDMTYSPASLQWF